MTVIEIGPRRWGWTRQAFLWVSPLAATPRFALQAATAEMMSGSDCAKHLSVKSWCTIRGHCSDNPHLRDSIAQRPTWSRFDFRPNPRSACAMQNGVRLALLPFLSQLID